MRYALMVAVAALAFGTAQAVENPNVTIWLDADPPNAVTRVEPESGSTFTVTIVMECFGPAGGTRGIGLLGVRTFSGFKLGQSSLLGGLDFGDLEVDGWTLAAGANCVFPTDGLVLIGEIQYLYQGTPGTLTLAPHPGTGRNTLDCNFAEDDQFCIGGGFGVWEDAPGNLEGCLCDAPVEASTWGSIKSLYR
jgi:hypothetical protein